MLFINLIEIDMFLLSMYSERIKFCLSKVFSWWSSGSCGYLV